MPFPPDLSDDSPESAIRGDDRTAPAGDVTFASAWAAEQEADDEPQPLAPVVGAGVPAVVAVVVTRNPGPWFDLTIDSLADQEYANLATLVVDAGSVVDPADRVADRLPTAFVKRVPDSGFAGAANEAAESVEGAAFLLLLHDDVALGPGTVQAMVEEAFRSNAGIVGAKLVDWDHPDLLRSVGASVDKFGFGWPVAEPGEMDQAQHDAVSDVFVVSSAAMLVRSDLFADLGGFATDIDGAGEELDLCWRARVAGARTVVTPAAVVRHRERSELGDPNASTSHLALRHQIRAVLANYSWPHLVRIVPQAMAFAVLDMLFSAVRGRFRHVAMTAGAITWNVAHLPTTFRLRRSVARVRRVSDSEIRALQIGGSARVSAFVRARRGTGAASVQAAFAAARTRTVSREDDGLWRLVAMAFIAVVVIVGSRDLVSGQLPAVREFASLGGSGDLLREWWSGWRPVGVGAAEQAPTLLGVVGVAQWLAVGSGGLLRIVVYLGPIVIGGWGVWRSLRHVCSPPARFAALVAFLANPLMHNAVAEGRWQALVVTAALPMVVVRVARAGRIAPFDDAMTAGSPQRQAVGLGGVFAAAGLVAPLAVPMGVIVALIVIVTMAIGRRASVRRAFGVVAGAVAISTVLHLPWALTLLGSSDRWSRLVGRDATAPDWPRLWSVISFDTGPHGGPLSIGLLVAAAAGLLIATNDRWRWVATGATLIVTAWAAIVFAGQLLGRFSMPAPELLAAPVGAGLVLGVGFGVDSLRDDVAGRTFGARQLVSAVAVVAALLAVLPFFATALGGRWSTPRSDISAATSVLEAAPGGSRTMWLGTPDALPSAGRSLEPGLGYSLTNGSTATLSAMSLGGEGGAEPALRAALRRAREGTIARLGSELGRFGIQYVVVTERVVPAPFATTRWPVDEAMTEALSRQVDLLRVDVVPGLVVYENVASRPVVSAVGDAEVRVAGSTARGVTDADTMVEFRPALPRRTEPTRASGPVAAADSIVVASNRSDRWNLFVGNRSAPPRPFGGWAASYDVGENGTGELRFEPSIAGLFLHLIQFLALLSLPWVRRRRVSELRARFARTSPREASSDQVGQPVDEMVGGRP